MTPIILSQDDLEQINALGITADQINRQLHLFQNPAYFITLERPCTLGDGIQSMPAEEISSCLEAHYQAAQAGRFQKFVPASGAASRMFKDLLQLARQTPEACQSSTCPVWAKQGGQFREDHCFLEEIKRFGFFQDLQNVLSSNGHNAEALIQENKCATILEYLLTPKGLHYANLPKGLLGFHSYPDGNRTAFEEHLVEAAAYVRDQFGTCRCHFTILPQHAELFQQLFDQVKPRYEDLFLCKLDLGISFQKQHTNTIAVDFDNQLIREKDNRLIFRPGGHGSLIENLKDLHGNLVYIKNIDNVTPDRLQEVNVTWKKILGGLLVNTQIAVHNYLHRLKNESDDGQLAEIVNFIQTSLSIHIPEQLKASTPSEQREYLIRKLNRPIRVCGVVKNAGEPGGGPFWVRERDGSQSLQIVERAQIDGGIAAQQQIWEQATHFNPVDLVCALRDDGGIPFHLPDYVDHQAVFISSKSKDGNELKALELPGLWNGAMSDWITIFVEVPSVTFNPVKTVWDLLRPEHQP